MGDSFMGSIRQNNPWSQPAAFPMSAPSFADNAIERKLSEVRAHSGRHIFCDELVERPNVKRLLGHFDKAYGSTLSGERRALADPHGTLISDSALPASVMRAVIREAFSDFRALDIAQVITDPAMGATTQIPYETRLAGTVLNDGIVYEGQGIPRASVQQGMCLVYVNAMKLSFLLSNEIDFLSRNSEINWSAFDSLIASNARIIRERVHMRLCKELQRAADAYQAVAIAGENIAAQLTGSNSLIKTAHWPMVRPHQTRDLQGTAVGSAECPITVIVNGTTLSEYDGSGTQSAGTYWILENANLGFVRLVTQAGVAATPTASTTCTMAYSYATNCSKFDLKLPAGVALENHLNGALRAIAARKSELFNKRLVRADFLFGGAILLDQLSNATSFSINDQRAGTDLTKSGDLGVIKGMPAYSSNAPNTDFGDERVLIGEKGTITYAVAKPWATGAPFEAVDASGKPTGQRQAYGEEYNAVYVPPPIRYKLTSVIVYDSDARAAAA